MVSHKHWKKDENVWKVNEDYDCSGSHCYIPSYITMNYKRTLKTEIENRVFGTDIFKMIIEKENELTRMLVSFGVKSTRNIEIGLGSLSLRPRAHPQALRGIRAAKVLKESQKNYNKKLRQLVDSRQF